MDTFTALGAAGAALGPMTSFIASQNNGIFTAFSLFIDRYFYIVLPASIIIFYKKLGRRRVASLVLCMLLLYLSVTFMKVFLHQPRPCNEYLKESCPEDYAFPSGHSSVAFAFAYFSIGTVAFPFYYVSAFIVSLSRIYLGVHVLNDVIGGAVTGIFCYFIAQKVVEACLRYEGG
ncbi:phosphatase PAP2 family protein [Candidatus Micrarchaeota archaeon]|nr:phosphatase PAP2 family protein [Candidatus Micrarchaeota archaeon]